MYAFIEGQVCEKTASTLVILAAGVGWQLNCSMNTLQAAPAMGQTMRCYTHLMVREDAMDLYGFATKEERNMFQVLIGVNGIGAKMALSLLGSMPLSDLNLAILMDDTSALCRAPGVGKKLAQRLVMELKDKLSQSDLTPADITLNASGGAAVVRAGDAVSEALEALVSLGYSATEARVALGKVKNPEATTEDLIRLALRSMAGM